MSNEIQRIFSILKTVAEDYIVLIDVNLVTEKEVQYQIQGDDLDYSKLPKWTEADDYQVCISDYANMFIMSEDRARFMEATKLNRLKVVLASQREFVIDYDVVLEGKRHHFEGRFTISNEIPDEPHMFIGIRDVTETVKYEARSREIAEYENYKQELMARPAGRKTLLVVEDDEISRQMLVGLLEDEYDILQAEDGESALDVLTRSYQDISVILLDMIMPGMNGRDFLARMKADKLYRSIPVIVTTSNNTPDEEARCLEMGASDFVSKPYNPKVIISRIRNLIKLRESAAMLAAVETDELTGLLTRQAFYRHAEQLLWQYPDDNFCIMISDIEGFKQINDRFGRRMGDKVLTTFAGVLAQAETADRVIGRYDSDRFIAIVRTAGDSVDIPILESIVDSSIINMPMPDIVIKYGLYDHVDHTLPIATLCDRAIMALRTVKHIYDVRFGIFNENMLLNEAREHNVEKSMRDAYDNDQFRIYYQPKHDATTGKLLGAEALLRWQHPEYGFMAPGEFIPVFERTGFITWADYYVFKRTCINQRKWLNKGIRIVPVSVNASRVDFNHPDFLDKIVVNLTRNNLAAKYMHIEVTETAFSNNIDMIAGKLKECRDYGIKVELDDFGTGYSSLNTLTDLPIDVVKLDMVFMKQIHNPKKSRVLNACINLAKELDLTTVVEGVETEDQLYIVKNFGADMVQGYYYSKPIPEEEFEQYLREHMG